jgi:hypothetical protein
MTEATWHYLEEVWGEDMFPDGDFAALILRHWPDFGQSVKDLAGGWMEVKMAEEDEDDRETLLTASEQFDVGGLTACLPVMRQFFATGLKTVGSPAIEFLQRRLTESDDLVECAASAVLLGEFGAVAVGATPVLAIVLADGELISTIRVAAACALGQIGAATAEDVAEEALAGTIGVLARVAGDPAEPQSLRAYCMEALMDIGPPARSAIPALERIHRDETEDEDLHHFAWSALRSVGSSSREHPCGGTVAEHMRSLYRSE